MSTATEYGNVGGREVCTGATGAGNVGLGMSEDGLLEVADELEVSKGSDSPDHFFLQTLDVMGVVAEELEFFVAGLWDHRLVGEIAGGGGVVAEVIRITFVRVIAASLSPLLWFWLFSRGFSL